MPGGQSLFAHFGGGKGLILLYKYPGYGFRWRAVEKEIIDVKNRCEILGKDVSEDEEEGVQWRIQAKI